MRGWILYCVRKTAGLTVKQRALAVAAIVLLPATLNAQEFGEDRYSILADKCKRQPKACDKLSKIALESKKSGERRTAIHVLEDQNVLATVAIQDPDPDNRSTAAVRIQDQKLLAKVVKASTDAGLRRAVAKRLTDRPVMIDVAENTNDSAIRSVLLSTLIRNLNVDELVELLKSIPDFVAFKDSFGNAALFHASYEGHIDVMRNLLANKADVNAPDSAGSTPLEIAAAKGRLDAVDLLLANKANPSAEDKDGSTPMHMAANFGSVEVARSLLAAGADVNCRTKNGFEPIHNAAARGHAEMIAWLLANKADADARAGNGVTPLYSVATSGSIESAKLLLAAGADVNGVANDGTSPLDAAAQHGPSDMVALLLSHNAEVNHRDSMGDQPLAFAASSGSEETVRRLLSAGGDVNAADSKGQTALHLAAGGKGSVGVAGVLINAGANVNAKTHDGSTALHFAAGYGKTDLIRLLIADGASLDAKMNDGSTPATIARKSNQNEATELLLDAAATPVEVDTGNLHMIQSLGSDVVFFTSKAHPITNIADINNPDTQFAVAEFSTRMMHLRKLFASATTGTPAKADSSVPRFAGTGVQFGMPGVLYPLGMTYAAGADGALTGIGEGAVENLFVQHPELRLYAAVRKHSDIEKIEDEWGGQRVRFVEKKETSVDTAGHAASSAEPQRKLEPGTTKTGSIKYSRVVIRNGALVLKDFQDSYEGDGWVSGIVVSSSAKILIVKIAGPSFSTDSSGVKPRNFTVTVDEKTSVCIAQRPAAPGASGTGGLAAGQRVSVAFRKGMRTADKIVDQSYEIITRMATPLTGAPTKPSMPECD